MNEIRGIITPERSISGVLSIAKGEKGDKGENDVFIFDIFLVKNYETEKLHFTTLYTFNEIQAEINKHKMVFARYNLGITVLLPLRTADTDVIYFNSYAGGALSVEIQKNNACLVYTWNQKSAWEESEISYEVDPLAIYMDMKNYNAENSFKVNITVEDTEVDNPLYPTYSDNEKAIIQEYSADKTFDEIYEAYDDGKNIFAYDSCYIGCDFLKYIPAEGSTLASFVFCRKYTGNDAYCYQIFSDDTVEPSSIHLILREEDDEDED